MDKFDDLPGAKVESEDSEQFDVFAELAEFFDEKLTAQKGDSDEIDEDEQDVAEDIYFNASDFESENIGQNLLGDPLSGFVLAGDDGVFVEQLPAEYSPIMRKPLAPLVSWQKYLDLAYHLSKHIQSQDHDSKAVKEILRRLTEFYDRRNDVFPSITLHSSFGEVFGAVCPDTLVDDGVGANGEKKKKPTTRYKHADLSAFIISEIQNGRKRGEIYETIARYIESGSYVTSNNKPFRLTATNRTKALEFLSSLEQFYKSDLASYNMNSSRRHLAQYNIRSSLDYMLSYISKEELAKEIETGDVGTSLAVLEHSGKIPHLGYPAKIYLDSDTFICGSCGSEQSYNRPFLESGLMNVAGDELLMLKPTLEICAECGCNNMLPANYFELIAKNLRSMFRNRIDINTLREQLGRLSSDFSVYSYELPKAALLDALPSDMKSLIEDRGSESFEIVNQQGIKKIDVSAFAAAFKRKTQALREARNVNKFMVPKQNEDNLIIVQLVNDDRSLKMPLVASSYAVMARVFCTMLGSDYQILKSKAVNSFLFWLEDYIPFIVNPALVAQAYAANLVGLQEDDEFSNISAEFKAVQKNLIDAIDYFVFVPISVASSQHRNLGHYTQDKNMRDLLDYVTDAMIIYHLRADLIDLCLVGTAPPFDSQKVKLRSILANINQRDAMLRKFEKALNAHAVSMVPFGMTRYHWLANTAIDDSDTNSMLKAFSAKDIYDVAKIAMMDSRYANIAMNLGDICEQVRMKSKLEFYYGDLFPEEDFSKYNDSDISLFYVVDKEEGETFEKYLAEIRSRGPRSRKGKLQYRDWFGRQVDSFFTLLKASEYNKVRQEDLLYMDIMKHMTVYETRVILRAFSVSDSILNTMLAAPTRFDFLVKDKEEEFAKQLLFLYPYKSHQLQQLISEVVDDTDVDTVIKVLLQDTEALEEEFAEASGYVKEVLKKQFALNFE